MAIANDGLSLRRSLALITIAGCLAMVYTTAISSPATTEFFRWLGADEFQFGLLSGIPLVMLFMQFAGVLVTNRLRHRKWVFIALVILARLHYPVIAALPFIFRSLRGVPLMWAALVLILLSNMVANLCVPLWFSWMGDLIPRRKLNSYWGHRQVWMLVAWMLSYLAVAVFVRYAGFTPDRLFLVMVCIGCLAGVVDILLFIWVREPPNPVITGQNAAHMLTEPLRHKEFRTFVAFLCIWTAIVMLPAAFMMLYVLKVLEIHLWKTTLIWTTTGIGGALTSRAWGRLADRHGNRPLMVFCVTFKPIAVLAFLLVTRQSAVYVFPTLFFFDSMLNAGVAVATNGYMQQCAPRANRSAFIASITGLSGICGGLGSMAGGLFLKAFAGFSWEGLGRVWNNYHLLFAAGFILRILCIPLVYRVKEDKSSHTGAMLMDLRGIWPFRMLMYPVGLFRGRGTTEH